MLQKAFLILSTLILVSCSSNQPTPNAAAEEKTPGELIELSSSEPLKEGLGRTDIKYVEASATVKAIDAKKRSITILGQDRKLSTFTVDPAVKRLAEIKVGDKVLVRYFQSLAFEVREPTEAERKSPKVIVEAAGKNSAALPPGMAAARSIHAIVKIKAIDVANQKVTVRGPEGREVEVQVHKPENLHKIKVGDTVAVTYTEGLAIGIEPLS